METLHEKDTLRKYRIYIPVFIQFAATLGLLSVVCVSSSELPPGELSKHWWWLARMGFIYTAGIWLSFLFYPRNYKCRIVDYAYIVSWSFILLGGYEAVLGLRQIYGLTYSNHSLFALTGSFFNPGPYSGYLALVFPICLNEYFRLKKISRISVCAKIVHYIALSVLLLIICVLPAGMSRSAWVAAGISGLFVAWFQNDWGKVLKQIWYKNKKKVILWAVSGGLCVLLGLSLIFYLKKDSANGRLFMWKISLRAISERPFTGYGSGGFPEAYGMAQETYFATGEYAEWEEHVAGSPEYAFNEYLQIAIEWGIPALLACIVIIAICLWRGIRLGRISVCGGVLSLAVFSFSSYPLQLPVFIVALIILLFACIDGSKRLWLMVFSLVILCLCFFLWKTDDYQSSKKWAQIRIFYNTGAYKTAKKEYDSLYPVLKNRAEFMFEYGRCLHKLGEYDASIAILRETALLTPDPMVFNVIGQCYQTKGEYEKAEDLFLRSSLRLPGRIYPYFLLAKLYVEPGFYQLNKFEYAARMVMEKEPKVQSTAIREMREEIRKLQEKLSIR